MIQMDLSHIRQFIPLPYEEARAAQLRLAHSHLQHGDGAGGEFTGWVHSGWCFIRSPRALSRITIPFSY